jgi:hypothetical protein
MYLTGAQGGKPSAAGRMRIINVGLIALFVGFIRIAANDLHASLTRF